MDGVLNEVEAANSAFTENHATIVVQARKVVDALDKLPKNNSRDGHPRVTGQLFQDAVSQAARLLALIEEFRAPAFLPWGAAVEESLHKLFGETYDVRFGHPRGKRNQVLVFPRDAERLRSTGQIAELKQDLFSCEDITAGLLVKIDYQDLIIGCLIPFQRQLIASR